MAIPRVGDATLKQKMTEMYQDWARDNQDLIMTKDAAAIWSHLIKKNLYSDKWLRIEETIHHLAKSEWGENTEIIPDRDQIKIKIINPKRQIEIEWDYEILSKV